MLLVIGYGNELRRDDGVGPRVARRVEEWGIAGVHTLAVHQLMPELTEEVAGARSVVFVDACVDRPGGEVQCRPVGPDPLRNALGHTANPGELLFLAQALYGHAPQAWLITIPATDMGFGEDISPTAAQGMETALERIRQWVSREKPHA